MTFHRLEHLGYARILHGFEIPTPLFSHVIGREQSAGISKSCKNRTHPSHSNIFFHCLADSSERRTFQTFSYDILCTGNAYFCFEKENQVEKALLCINSFACQTALKDISFSVQVLYRFRLKKNSSFPIILTNFFESRLKALSQLIN